MVAGSDVPTKFTVMTGRAGTQYHGLRGRIALGAAVAAVRALATASANPIPPPFSQCRGLKQLRKEIRSLGVLQVCYLPEKLVWTTAHIRKSSDDLVVPDIFGALWDDVLAASVPIRRIIGTPHTILLEPPTEGPTTYLSHRLSDELAVVVGGAEGREAVFTAFKNARRAIFKDLSLTEEVFGFGNISFDPAEGEVEKAFKLQGTCNPQCVPIGTEFTRSDSLSGNRELSREEYQDLRPLLEKLVDRGTIIFRWLAQDRFLNHSRLTVIGTDGLLGAMIRPDGHRFRLTIAAAGDHCIGSFSQWLEA